MTPMYIFAYVSGVPVGSVALGTPDYNGGPLRIIQKVRENWHWKVIGTYDPWTKEVASASAVDNALSRWGLSLAALSAAIEVVDEKRILVHKDGSDWASSEAIVDIHTGVTRRGGKTTFMW